MAAAADMAADMAEDGVVAAAATTAAVTITTAVEAGVTEVSGYVHSVRCLVLETLILVAIRVVY